MKKLLIIVFGILIVGAVYGQNQKPVTKRDAALFLNKTNKIMHETAEVVKDFQVYTGGLIAAKDFQGKAIKNFDSGNYQQCVNSSYTARRLAFRAYLKNKNQNPPRDWTLNRVEQHLVTIQVTPKQIDDILANIPDKNKEQDINLDDVNDVEIPD